MAKKKPPKTFTRKRAGRFVETKEERKALKKEDKKEKD